MTGDLTELIDRLGHELALEQRFPRRRAQVEADWPTLVRRGVVEWLAKNRIRLRETPTGLVAEVHTRVDPGILLWVLGRLRTVRGRRVVGVRIVEGGDPPETPRVCLCWQHDAQPAPGEQPATPTIGQRSLASGLAPKRVASQPALTRAARPGRPGTRRKNTPPAGFELDPADPASVARWLEAVLERGPRPASTITAMARHHGIAGDVLEQAAKLAGVRKFGFRGKFWERPAVASSWRVQ